ncbi:MAG: hypothetical protein AMK69_12375 [Nitrospira bacterium SG8_3]|nr:MAG: hypothetical protein AMK69_12375 [Nitrospira bacterium SG8_3]
MSFPNHPMAYMLPAVIVNPEIAFLMIIEYQIGVSRSKQNRHLRMTTPASTLSAFGKPEACKKKDSSLTNTNNFDK